MPCITQDCSCDIGLAPSGVKCTTKMRETKLFMLMPMFDSTGAQNKIDLTTTLNQAYFDALINNADKSKRLFPFPEVKDVEDKREKPIVKAFKDGTMEFKRQGVNTFDCIFPTKSASTVLVGMLAAIRCGGDVGFYRVDANGTIIGNLSEDGNSLYPVQIDEQSASELYMHATDTENELVGFSFNFHPSEKDACLRGLKTSELTGSVNPLYFKGLLHITIEVVDANDTDFTFKLKTDFGNITSPTLDEGLVVSDFTLYNKTQASAIGFTGSGGAFEETTPGLYKITYNTADQPTVADILTLTPDKTGRDYESVIDTDIVVA